MVDALDLLQCPVCSTFYKPEITATGRLISHCVSPDATYRVEWLNGEVHVVRSLLTEGVVDPPLTGSLLDIEV